MKKLLAFTILVAGILVAGCQGGGDETKGAPIKEGDYTTEPGGAQQPK
jgi:hypothetical protein